jgi:hypothetical protein
VELLHPTGSGDGIRAVITGENEAKQLRLLVVCWRMILPIRAGKREIWQRGASSKDLRDILTVRWQCQQDGESKKQMEFLHAEGIAEKVGCLPLILSKKSPRVCDG